MNKSDGKKTCNYHYKFGSRKKCNEEVLPKSKKCILHINLPKNKESNEFNRLKELKEKKIRYKIEKKDYNFVGARLFKIDLSGMEIEDDLDFPGVHIEKDALLRSTKINGHLNFDGAKIGGNVELSSARVRGSVSFLDARINDAVVFWGAKISNGILSSGVSVGSLNFNNAEIGGWVQFSNATIGNVFFDNAKFGDDVHFDNSEINGNFLFELTEIKGVLTFKDTTFKLLEAQIIACRSAKNSWKKLGDNDEIDYYYYLEMKAKRQQKKWIPRKLELPIQYIFGYGTRWERVLLSWVIVVLGFSLTFWHGNGVQGANSFWDNFYFSVVTATTLGYGDLHPTAMTVYNIPIFRMLASFEAMFGTFMWAAFIVIFARKYMK